MYRRNNSWHCCIFTDGVAGAVGFGDFCKAANVEALTELRLAWKYIENMPVTVVGGGGGGGEAESGAMAVSAYSTS